MNPLQETLGLNSSFGFLFKLCFIYTFWTGSLVTDAGDFSIPNLRSWRKANFHPCFRLLIDTMIEKLFSLCWLKTGQWQFSGEKSPHSSGHIPEGNNSSPRLAQCSSAHARREYSCSAATLKYFQAAKQSQDPPHDLGFILFFLPEQTASKTNKCWWLHSPMHSSAASRSVTPGTASLKTEHHHQCHSAQNHHSVTAIPKALSFCIHLK